MLRWGWHWNIDDNYYDGCGLWIPLPPALRDDRFCFQAKVAAKLYPEKPHRAMKPIEDYRGIPQSTVINKTFHLHHPSLSGNYLNKNVHIGYALVINGCLNLLQAQHNKCSVISWMTPQPLLFCQNWRHWHHVQCLSLFSHDVASPNVMYFPQQDTCNLGDGSAGSA